MPRAFGLIAGAVALLACAVPASGSTRPAEPRASATGAARAVPDSSGTDTIDAYNRGRRYTHWLFASDFDSLSARMSPAVLRAVGGGDGLTQLRQRLAAKAGEETAVVSEHIYREPGAVEYYRVSRFAATPDTTWTTRWAWTPDDTIVALSLTITPAPAPSAYLGYDTKTDLHLLLATPPGTLWYVGWGGRTVQQNYHAIASDQRFAYDFVLTKGGAAHSGSGAQNTDFYCFGTPVLAPASGRVTIAVDSVNDNVPGIVNRATPPGNYVVIDHGHGEFSLIAHFRRGSVRVRPGEQVRTGQQLGECGNSGNATLPHVHYHLQTGPDYKDGVGLPAFFNSYIANGRPVTRGEPVRGQYIQPSQ
ncbi:MAG: M23 family metallopeptidase [Gemmatimonadaceae bacterium]